MGGPSLATAMSTQAGSTIAARMRRLPPRGPWLEMASTAFMMMAVSTCWICEASQQMEGRFSASVETEMECICNLCRTTARVRSMTSFTSAGAISVFCLRANTSRLLTISPQRLLSRWMV